MNITFVINVLLRVNEKQCGLYELQRFTEMGWTLA